MDAHYRGKNWNEFEIGDSAVTAGRTITETDTVLFGSLTGDWNPLHMDQTFAANSPYGQRIAHGAFGQSLMVGLAAQLGIFEGSTIALRKMDTKFKSPIYFGDTVYVILQVEEKKLLRDDKQGLVIFKAKLLNQNDKVLIDSIWSVLMRKD
ncbi:MAG: dehydratase [Planctomycetes bacterium]|nr:dehydratase [Planctomycetota bacterium]